MSFEDPPLDLAELEEAAARAADLVVEIYRELESRPVAPPHEDGAATFFAGRLGEVGIGLAATVEELARDVVPRSLGTPHPLYLGLVNSSPLPGAVLADLVVSALDNNAGAAHQSPAASLLEGEVVRAFAGLFGVEMEGLLVPGGTFATLQAVLLARERAFPRWSAEGPQATDGAPRLYTADASHFSIARAGHAVGLGRAGVVALPSRGRGALDVDTLHRRIVADRAAGHRPFCVVATVGTTGTGAIDPLAEIAELCQAEGLWLHVDACYGGAIALLPELRHRLAGIEHADSIAVDPHKWFFVPITAGLLLTRHRDLELATFDTAAASYIPRGATPDALRRGLPTSRRASGLTVWAALRAHGWTTIRDAVGRNIALCRRLEGQLAEHGFRVLPDGELSIVCARWEPPDASPEAVDALQRRLAERVVATGEAWFAPVLHAGRVWLRFNLVNLHTRERHLDRLVELLVAAVAEETGTS